MSRAELLAQAKRALAAARGGLAAARAAGDGLYEQGQYKATIRRCEDDIAMLQPLDKSGSGESSSLEDE